jgi:hypothetical protein
MSFCISGLSHKKDGGILGLHVEILGRFLSKWTPETIAEQGTLLGWILVVNTKGVGR